MKLTVKETKPSWSFSFTINMISMLIINENSAELSFSKNQELVDWLNLKIKSSKLEYGMLGDVLQGWE